MTAAGSTPDPHAGHAGPPATAPGVVGAPSESAARSPRSPTSSPAGSCAGMLIGWPHLHFTRLPANSGFHEYVLPHASHENLPAIGAPFTSSLICRQPNP